MQTLRSVIAIFLAGIFLVSCSDINQSLVINADGSTSLKMGSDIFQLMEMGDSELLDSLSDDQPSQPEEFNFDTALDNPDKMPDVVDTLITFDMTENSDLTEAERALLKNVGVRFDINKPMEKAYMELFINYKDLEEREKMMIALDKVMKDEKEAKGEEVNNEKSMTDLPDNLISYELDLDNGKLVILDSESPDMLDDAIGKEEDEKMSDADITMMAAFMPGGFNYSITVPGKIYNVTAEDYEIVNGNTVVVSTPFTELMKTEFVPGFTIDFEPTKPITDPKVTEVWDPEPEVVTPSKKKCSAPSDALILFGGKNMDEWVHYDGRPAEWKVGKKTMTVKPGSGTIKTKRDFGDIQLHIEWKSPKEPGRKGQDKGNSGVFFQNKYEVQILNSFQNRTYSNGQAASIYKQYPPLVNAMNPPGEWNVYDIIFHAPRFDDNGQLTKSGTLTVMHNGILVQDHVEIQGTTEYIGRPKTIPHGDGPLVIQDHSNEVSFRNIWVREL